MKPDPKAKIIFPLILFFGISGLGKSSWAATYYIDYASGYDGNTNTIGTPWKRCPGMVGFSGNYTHSAGDKFVFKGDSTWPSTVLPLTIAYSGTSGHIDTYIGGQYEGSPWGSGYPVFDGDKNTELIVSNNKDYIHISGLKFINTENVANPILAIYGQSVRLSYCDIETHSVNGVSFAGNRATIPVGNWEIDHNYFFNNVNDLILQAMDDMFAPWNGGVVDVVKIHDNEFAGRDSNLNTGSSHPDGIQFETRADAYTFTNVKMYNNWFHGNWYLGNTSTMWISGIDGGKVYNNVFTFDNATAECDPGFNSNAHLYMAGAKNIEVYNNTSSSDADSTGGRGIQMNFQIAGGHHLKSKGNIFSKANFCLGLVNDRWTANTDYPLLNEYERTYVYPSNIVAPYPAGWNGYIYELTGTALSDSDFQSGSSEPAWNPDATGPIRDNNLGWRPWYPGTAPVWQPNHVYDYYDRICPISGCAGNVVYYLWKKYVRSGSSQPQWPTSDGTVMNDNQAVWTARTVFTENDYNFYQPRSGGHVIAVNTSLWTSDLAAWQASPYNMEPHSTQGDPKFVKLPTGITDPGNWQLQDTSPAKDVFPTAQAPTSIFTSDILGAARPQGPAWDMGAYEYGQGGDTTLPAAPTGLSVN